MEQLINGYFFNGWVLFINVVVFLLFGLKSYDVYAKTWLAHTGEYFAEGTITYSEFFVSPKRTLDIQYPNQGIISYSYSIDNKLYVGTVYPGNLTQEEVDKFLYKGAKVKVYYSPKLPSYSFVQNKPSQFELIQSAVSQWLVIPVCSFNFLALLVWAVTKGG